MNSPTFVPFPPERAATYRAAGHWTGRPLDSVLRDAATAWPDRVAVIDDSGSRTYSELDDLADRAAAGFRGIGIAPGQRVLMQLPNSCRFAVTLFALLRAGAIPVMCLPGHRLAELTHFAEVSQAVALVITDTAGGFDYRAMADELVRTHPMTIVTELVTESADPPPVDVDTASPALLLVSGGTTGAPKLIPRTHDDYLYNVTASAELCGLTAADVYLVALPAAHNFPLACPGLLGAMSVGATTVFTADPSPESAFAAIARHGVTVTALVPALAKLWAQACEWEPQRPTTLRLLQVGGAKLGADDARAVREALTPGLQQVFGMAEGLLNYTRLGDPPDIVDNTQGRPLSEHDELKVVDDAGNDVAPGEEGELLVRGPYTLNGYFNAATANERSFTPDGFYRTGDRVRRFANGYLEVTGRVKDVIVRGGENVSALDLEEHLLKHPSIWAVAAVAVPDNYLGEKICAAVVFNGSSVALPELNSFLDSRGVAAHARPDLLVSMPSLPTTAVGKVDKKAIAKQLVLGNRTPLS
ncbi:AMP-binding protein [Mycobacterium sp. OAE908]|uniref:(2,3-dihydroxybenzoyl)adenylate synthase n=1 Tax=Mycobacterium sp. OAE908 TaxID=2817899 RepID=UPI001AEB87B4